MRYDIDNDEEPGLLFDHGGLVPTVCWALLLAAAGLSTLLDPGVPTGPRLESVIAAAAGGSNAPAVPQRR